MQSGSKEIKSVYVSNMSIDSDSSEHFVTVHYTDGSDEHSVLPYDVIARRYAPYLDESHQKSQERNSSPVPNVDRKHTPNDLPFELPPQKNQDPRIELRDRWVDALEDILKSSDQYKELQPYLAHLRKQQAEDALNELRYEAYAPYEFAHEIATDNVWLSGYRLELIAKKVCIAEAELKKADERKDAVNIERWRNYLNKMIEPFRHEVSVIDERFVQLMKHTHNNKRLQQAIDASAKALPLSLYDPDEESFAQQMASDYEGHATAEQLIHAAADQIMESLEPEEIREITNTDDLVIKKLDTVEWDQVAHTYRFSCRPAAIPHSRTPETHRDLQLQQPLPRNARR